ncbi:lycopene cyclase [Rhodococcus sp. EPR-157]|uniref:lycopene cyclase family protein n=1 Tax=Rhodococcus sp. EPR-157 TaxID=1813677 RepID=UPI0007BBC812|nr:lycopene cyclase family protein [Rhodococcus sp. EPR-157]KZF13118.1 lycopene cyclase [Rhodococcus sp. EPR-157]
MNRSLSADLVVVGLGPAGRALSNRASVADMDVIAVDTHPDRQWTPTYSAWADELPEWLPTSAVGSITDMPAAFTTKLQPIDRTYCVLDTAALQKSLETEKVRVLAGTAASVTSTSVRLTDGRELTGRTVVDARGSMGLTGLAEQTSYGVVVDRDQAEPLLEGSGAWFMDWRYDNGAATSAVPSFLYAVALDGHHLLLEETCLVGRPPLDYRELQRRLHTRLASRGLTLSGTEPVERVRFPVQPPPRSHSDRGSVRFGARSSMMHPATGYSVAASLAAADSVIEALRHGKRVGTLSVWTVQRLRNLGLRTALGLDPELVPHFFASFFDLPVTLQRSYLSGRSDATGTALAMTRMFPTLPSAARLAIARTVLGR